MEGNTNSGSSKSRPYFIKMHSSGLTVEHRRPGVALSVDIADHISRRHTKGKIAVVASHPQALMNSVCKQWLKLMRIAECTRANTLSQQRKGSLNEVIRSMRGVSFTAEDPVDEPLAYVSFATAEQFITAAPVCATLYVTAPVTKLDLHMLVSWMGPGSMVVIYDK